MHFLQCFKNYFYGMYQRVFVLYVLLFASPTLFAQRQNDTTIKVNENYITLSEIVINSKLDVPSFIKRVKDDTSFYKAFRNLRILGYSALNDIRMLDKKGNIQASLNSKTKQVRTTNCRKMKVLNQTTTGDMYDKDSSFNYYTAQMYASLFFTKDSVCGENNIVKGHEFSTGGLSGIDKHKEQLKMLFFNPGKKIPGIPFIGNKINVFDPDVAVYYDFLIDQADYEGKPCYLFSIKAKESLTAGERDKIVIDDMVTWFDAKTMEVMARNYRLSYDAGAYDFDVSMEVQMTKFGDHLVPKTLRYNGNWDVVFKKRERGMFTATLFDFTN